MNDRTGNAIKNLNAAAHGLDVDDLELIEGVVFAATDELDRDEILKVLAYFVARAATSMTAWRQTNGEATQ